MRSLSARIYKRVNFSSLTAFNIDCSDKIQENNNFPVLKFGVWILALTLEEMNYIVLNKSWI